jgi:SnoaL-like domain
MTELTALADRLEIIEVCTRVHWSYDHEDWDALDELFAGTVSMPTLAQASEPGFDVDGYLSRYLFTREEVKRALASVKTGMVTQHLVAGHQVTRHGNKAMCLAHSVNIHLTSSGFVQHGNEYRFDLTRTAEGWRIRGWIPRVRWTSGDESSYNVAARQATWLE